MHLRRCGIPAYQLRHSDAGRKIVEVGAVAAYARPRQVAEAVREDAVGLTVRGGLLSPFHLAAEVPGWFADVGLPRARAAASLRANAAQLAEGALELQTGEDPVRSFALDEEAPNDHRQGVR